MNFQRFITYSYYTLLVDMFVQHYRTEMIYNNTVRFAEIIQHVHVQPLAQIIVEYVYS